MDDEYLKKRYEKLLDYVYERLGKEDYIEAMEWIKEQIEIEEMEREGTVEGAKVRKVTRHDTP